ncbi:MAG TPA: EamA family transporter [Burkholderiales bacterium]|nr:EamA family transporter [Burkholderiales bacterium]
MSAALAFRLGLAIALDTIVQLLWKLAATDFEPLVVGLVVVIFIAQLINWLRVLEMSDLSYSQPITSLSYITVLGFSVIWLGEDLDPLKVAGIVLIIAGVWFISRGPHHSHAR